MFIIKVLFFLAITFLTDNGFQISMCSEIASNGRDKIISNNRDYYKLVLYILNIIFCAFFLIVLIVKNNLDSYLLEPLMTPAEYLAHHPWVQVGSFIWTEPSSSAFIFGFATQATILGIYFLVKNQKNPFLIWWGIALIAWGLSAYFAGTSYQALSFELKCRGYTYCLWTSWCEIVYLCLTALSISGMLFAQSYLLKSERGQKGMQYYALGSFIIYLIVLILGMLLTVKFLLTFEMLIIFMLPAILLMFGLNIKGASKDKNPKDKHAMWIWIVLGIAMVAYYAFYLSGIPELLWEKGIWFNANDVLHIGLICWMIVIFVKLKKITSNSQ